MGHRSCVGVFVVYSGQSVRLTGSIANRRKIRPHPVGRVRCAGSRHDNITTLTHAESDHVGCVWHDGHKIVGNNCHIVAIDGKILNTFSASVDEPKSVCLAGLKLEFGKAGIRCALLVAVQE